MGQNVDSAFSLQIFLRTLLGMIVSFVSLLARIDM